MRVIICQGSSIEDGGWLCNISFWVYDPLPYMANPSFLGYQIRNRQGC
jgi:hypothetical protein